jgi:glycyl-tRNA synthetase (class II)
LHNGFPSINIIVTNLSDHQIDINIDNDIEIGTAYFNTDPLTDKFRFIYFEPVPTEFQTVTDGSITITERTATRIKGTFYFNAINPSAPLETRSITEGSFDVAIP